MKEHEKEGENAESDDDGGEHEGLRERVGRDRGLSIEKGRTTVEEPAGCKNDKVGGLTQELEGARTVRFGAAAGANDQARSDQTSNPEDP